MADSTQILYKHFIVLKVNRMLNAENEYNS